MTDSPAKPADGTSAAPPPRTPGTIDEIKAKIKEDLSRITAIPPSAIRDDATFQQDLGLDSLSLLELVVHLEYAFKIKVPEDDLPALLTVTATAQYVDARQRSSSR